MVKLVKMSEDTVIKCVAIGDGFVGKTSLLTRLAKKDVFYLEYAPTVFDNSSVEIEIEGKKYNLHLIDTAGQEDYEHLRKQAYNDVDIFLLCFSVTNMSSFSNLNELWIPELKRYQDRVPILLIGTKSDLRNDPETIDKMNISGEIFVSQQAALNFAKTHKIKYIECSAKTKDNVIEVLNSIVTTAAKWKSVRDSTCRMWFLNNPVTELLKRAFCCDRYST